MKIKKFLQPFAGINIDDNYSNRNVVRNNDGSYNINYNNSNYTILPSALNSNNITVTTPEVVVTGKRPYSSWRWGTYVPFEYSRNSYYRPEDILESFINLSEKRSLENRGKSTTYITTGGAGYVPSVPEIILDKNKIYNRVAGDQWYNITNENRQHNYGTGGIGDAIKNYIFAKDDYVKKRLSRYLPYKNISWNEYIKASNTFDKKAEELHYNFDNLSNKDRKQLEALEDKATALPVIQHEDAKAVYLGLPQRVGTLKPAEYYPSQGKLNNGKYVTYMRDKGYINDILLPIYNDYVKGNVNTPGKKVIGEVIKLPKRVGGVNEITKKGNAVVNIPFLSNATMSKGRDEKGDYFSVFDTWDYNTKINATPGDDIMNIVGGKPFDIYDRYYLDDIYETPKEYRGNAYLPEVVVEGKRKKKSSGGSIHIAPSKRGTFTAAATKHGMSVQEFASRVLRNKDDYSPSLVKKANLQEMLVNGTN